jgi:hypothetical protein
MLRHEGLKGLASESARLIEPTIGRHPRTLGYLDALLRQGRARLGRVHERLSQYAKKAGVDLERPGSLEQRLAYAIRLAAADALLEELLQVVGENPGDPEFYGRRRCIPCR